jgi:hypothetical protein
MFIAVVLSTPARLRLVLAVCGEISDYGSEASTRLVKGRFHVGGPACLCTGTHAGCLAAEHKNEPLPRLALQGVRPYRGKGR